MARVTTAEVKVLIETDLTDLTAFITVADQLVDRVAAADSSLTAATLKEIARWLSAHFVAIRDPREAKSTVGPTSFTYEGKTGMGFNFTRYGQMAVELDPTGTLVSAKLKKASVSYLGYKAGDTGTMEAP